MVSLVHYTVVSLHCLHILQGKTTLLSSMPWLCFMKRFHLSVVNMVSFCSVSWHSFSSLTVPLIGCSYHEHSSVSAMWENLCRGPTSTDLYLPWCSQCSVYSPSHARLLSHTGKSSLCFPVPRTVEASIVVPHPRFPVVTLCQAPST